MIFHLSALVRKEYDVTFVPSTNHWSQSQPLKEGCQVSVEKEGFQGSVKREGRFLVIKNVCLFSLYIC